MSNGICRVASEPENDVGQRPGARRDLNLMKAIAMGLLISAVVLCSVQSSVGQDRQIPQSPGLVPVVPRDPVKDEENKLTRAANMARISLTEAVKTAQQKVSGKPIDATLAEEKGQPIYKVTILDKQGKLHIVRVDGIAGTAVENLR